ncbi:hypothetical protein D3C81_1841110 [compost metagenome]
MAGFFLGLPVLAAAFLPPAFNLQLGVFPEFGSFFQGLPDLLLGHTFRILEDPVLDLEELTQFILFLIRNRLCRRFMMRGAG